MKICHTAFRTTPITEMNEDLWRGLGERRVAVTAAVVNERSEGRLCVTVVYVQVYRDSTTNNPLPDSGLNSITYLQSAKLGSLKLITALRATALDMYG